MHMASNSISRVSQRSKVISLSLITISLTNHIVISESAMSESNFGQTNSCLE